MKVLFRGETMLEYISRKSDKSGTMPWNAISFSEMYARLKSVMGTFHVRAWLQTAATATSRPRARPSVQYDAEDTAPCYGAPGAMRALALHALLQERTLCCGRSLPTFLR